MKDPWENEIYEMTNILPRDQAVNRITTYKGQRLSSLPLISTITATANRTEIKRKCRWGTQASKWGSRMVDTVSFKNDQWSLWQEKKKTWMFVKTGNIMSLFWFLTYKMASLLRVKAFIFHLMTPSNSFLLSPQCFSPKLSCENFIINFLVFQSQYSTSYLLLKIVTIFVSYSVIY